MNSVMKYGFKLWAIAALCCSLSAYGYDQLLVLVLMVKNEAAVMPATLAPFVKAGIKDFFIFDTGSTDDTVQVTKKYLDNAGISSYAIEEEPFIDFATSRNHALERAEARFPNACFMLMPDAEWYLINGEKLLKFCQEKADCDDSSYMILLVGSIEFYTQRLLRVADHNRFAGVVHEAITKVSMAKVPADIHFEVKPSKKGYQKTANRWLRDKDLLLKDHIENPDNPRTCFYLAQTYECLGDFENAAHYYEKRTRLAGWDEENYMTYYRLAGVIEEGEKDKPDGWMRALDYYLKAYAMRPCRAEPLIKIANHYLKDGNHFLSYIFASRACQIAYPSNDVLFVEKTMYDYARYDILGQCAWYTADYGIGEKAVRDAMVARPEMPHLLRNLAFYLCKKQELAEELAAEEE